MTMTSAHSLTAIAAMQGVTMTFGSGDTAVPGLRAIRNVDLAAVVRERAD
jgi:hypothetical protein